MILIASLIGMLLLLGICEKRNHRKRLHSIPLRINVNGIRGKSTITRLITAILVEAGYDVIGKTTGTKPRLIYWNTPEEKAIRRKPQGANINEQIHIVKEAAELNANALVCECMALQPDYQKVFQEEMIQAQIGVIVNVLEDHMDILGPTLDQVADAFKATIPENGHLIVSKGPYTDYFERMALHKNSKIVVVDPDLVTDDYLMQFPYLVFPNNVAIGLGVAKALDIPKHVALRGMLKAQPDPGALFIRNTRSLDHPLYYVNGFAANDSKSTLDIWKRIESIGYPTDQAMMLINCRDDRIERTEQFISDVLPYLPANALAVIGSGTEKVVEAFEKGALPFERLLRWEDLTPEEVHTALCSETSVQMIFGIGNINGKGNASIIYLDSIDHRDTDQPQLQIVKNYQIAN